jgi:hypothetical protein
MRSFTMPTICLAVVACFTATAALAQNPHFIGTPTGALNTSGDYVASFKEAGLGSTPVTYTLTATTETFTFQCFTKSGNNPQGSPNSVTLSNESTSTTITPRNGQITGSILLTPEQDGASCQGGGLQLFLVSVAYEGVTLTDTTDNVSASLPSLSATGLHIGPFPSK